MNYCDSCIHKEVCGEEDARDPALTFCSHKIENDMEWIPITKQLPPEDTLVIITIRDDSGDSVSIYTSCGWFFNGIWVVDNERIDSCFVIAWKPMPAEPYKEV